MITDPPRPPPPAYVSALQPPATSLLAGTSTSTSTSTSSHGHSSGIAAGGSGAGTATSGADVREDGAGSRQWPPPLEPLLAGCTLGEHRRAGEEGPAAEASASGAGAAAQQPGEPRCLQEVCARVILRNISVHNCCELLEVARGMDGPGFGPIAAACLRYAVNSFETLVGLREEATLRGCLGPDVYDSLHAALEERRAYLASLKAGLGKVREREAPPAEAAAPRQETSVAGRPVCYPLAALAPGLVWPADVDGGCREQWLNSADWEAAFGPHAPGLTYEAFLALPGWRRSKLKQAAGLF
ncbi:hypothetical protein HYH02_012200 [Chlamydomonas schloesseri]|uniref:HP domain-containing protein n=1 Tax=Chlamydomonas schloesseri TaxID=2026947 RepID=A0A835W266_9CHLO|nr:hypothetical protein HYH02_012200 [Chlamydomonas schloesseri]|eukprot:KAG2434533.1 hypothetical protein HYH02_012200 [Chlamydomonas schloesseri]